MALLAQELDLHNMASNLIKNLLSAVATTHPPRWMPCPTLSKRSSARNVPSNRPMPHLILVAFHVVLRSTTKHWWAPHWMPEHLEMLIVRQIVSETQLRKAWTCRCRWAADSTEPSSMMWKESIPCPSVKVSLTAISRRVSSMQITRPGPVGSNLTDSHRLTIQIAWFIWVQLTPWLTLISRSGTRMLCQRRTRAIWNSLSKRPLPVTPLAGWSQITQAHLSSKSIKKVAFLISNSCKGHSRRLYRLGLTVAWLKLKSNGLYMPVLTKQEWPRLTAPVREGCLKKMQHRQWASGDLCNASCIWWSLCSRMKRMRMRS